MSNTFFTLFFHPPKVLTNPIYRGILQSLCRKDKVERFGNTNEKSSELSDPDLVKFIMLYCMDCYNDCGELCKHGTSPAAMNYMSSWLNHFGCAKKFPIYSEFLTGEQVVIAPDSKLYTALLNGGTVILHVFLDVAHYVLLTGIEKDRVLLFDPYYEEESDPDFDEEYRTDEITFVDLPKKANRSVSIERLNRFSKGYYEMGCYDCREALILYNTEITEIVF